MFSYLIKLYNVQKTLHTQIPHLHKIQVNSFSLREDAHKSFQKRHLYSFNKHNSLTPPITLSGRLEDIQGLLRER